MEEIQENNKKPSFFKIVVGDYLAEKLRIPPLFVKHISKDMSGRAIAEATVKSKAGCWPIKLKRMTNYIYMEEGWTNVMEDNALGDNEFLLFRYEGDMCFNLQVFEKSGCERIYTSVASNDTNNQRENMSQTDDMECFTEEVDAEDNVAARTTELPFSSQHPHVKICMKDYHVQRIYRVRLPSHFSRGFSATVHDGRKTIPLENSKGQVWEVTVSLNRNAFYLCNGWKDFVRANNIQLGDECIFEHMSENRMRVYKACC